MPGSAVLGAATIWVFAKLQGMECVCRIPGGLWGHGPESKETE